MAFVKLDKNITKWRWFNKDHMLKFWIYLLCNVAYSDYSLGDIEIKKGQVIIGKKNVGEKLGLSEQTIKTYIKRLKRTGEITTESTNRYTLITIVKWDEYQCIPQYINQQINQTNNQQVTNHQPTSNQQVTTIKEYKEQLEEKESLLMNNNTPEWFDTEVQKQDQADQEQKNIYECSLFDLFEREFARPLSQPECQRLGDWQERYDDKLIRYALRESLLYGKHSLDYIDRILLAWDKKAFTAEMYENGER